MKEEQKERKFKDVNSESLKKQNGHKIQPRKQWGFNPRKSLNKKQPNRSNSRGA